MTAEATKLDLQVLEIPGPEPITHCVRNRADDDKPAAFFTNSQDAYDYVRTKTETPEQAVDRAIGIIRHDYYQDTVDLATSIRDELNGRLKEQEYGESLREWLMEHIDETIDGTQRVIYTMQAKLGVISSDNDGAYFEEFGEEGAVEDGGINWSRLCYSAMRADVLKELERLDVDVNSPVPACGECDDEDQESERWEIEDQMLCTACKDKALAKQRAAGLTREKCVELLEAVSIECREEETVEVLREAVIANIEDDTIEPDEVPA